MQLTIIFFLLLFNLNTLECWKLRDLISVHHSVMFLHSMQVCGGGPSLSVWHLRSMACTSVLKTASTQQAALFHDDIVS